MTKLTRVTGKVFAGNADAGQVGQFGSAQTGTPNPTADVAEIQGLTAYGKGWDSAVVSSRNFPPLEEVNGVLKTISYQACYLLQEGVPTYDSGTEYSNTSIVKTISNDNLLFYRSLLDNNIGHQLTDTNWWEKVYFENEYEPNITANRSITLTGAVSGTVDYQISDASDNNITINTTLPILEQIYPVGSIYIGMTTTCPLASFFGTWNKISEGLTLQQADSSHPVGTEIEAGLPNIEGNLGYERENYMAYGGCVYYGGPSVRRGSFDGTINGNPARIDASLSNPIYGKSETVQPPALAVNIWRRVA